MKFCAATAPYLDHFTVGGRRGGGRIWVISEKNILQTDFKAKNCCKENRK